MRYYKFEVTVAIQLDNLRVVENNLNGAGCDDAKLCYGSESVTLSFIRSGNTFTEALEPAMMSIEAAKLNGDIVQIRSKGAIQ
jgi:hypothetical protein